MKRESLILLFLIAFLASCVQEQSSSLDHAALQKRLNADPEVAKARELFHEHSRILGSISPNELEAIFTQTHSCGFYTADAPMPELEKCLAGYPGGDKYVQCEKLLRAYRVAMNTIERNYPELSLLDYKQKAEILMPVTEEQAMQALSDYLANKNKK